MSGRKKQMNLGEALTQTKSGRKVAVPLRLRVDSPVIAKEKRKHKKKGNTSQGREMGSEPLDSVHDRQNIRRQVKPFQWKEGDSAKRKDLTHFKARSRNQRRTENKIQHWADRSFELLKQAVEATSQEEFDTLFGRHLLDTPIGGLVLPRENREGNVSIDTEDSLELDETRIIYESMEVDSAMVKLMKRINRALAVGDLKKAKRILSQNGIVDINDEFMRQKLMSKYPKKLVADESLTMRTDTGLVVEEIRNGNPIPVGLDVVNLPDAEQRTLINIRSLLGGENDMVKEIFSYKRDAAQSILGWSTDDLQDLLERRPDIRPILYEVVCRIMSGVIKDDVTIDLLLTSRGVPGKKGEKDVRPIVCQNPLVKIGEALLNRASQERILEVCGDRQLANKIQGGSEIIVHTVRAVLEMNPTWCCIKTDSVNAFNSLDRKQVSAKIREHIPSISPYVDFMLQGTEKVVYNDHRTNTCLVIDMECGIVQGAGYSECYASGCYGKS